MSKKSISRKDAESKEGLQQVANDMPDNKMQDEQQIATVESAVKTNGPTSGFNLTKRKGAGSQLKQEKISDVLTGAPGDSGMGITMGGRGASGTAGGILGANNSAPIASQSRSDSRVGKKLDRTATKLNYTPSEQTLVEFDESKPLADAANEDQGYNGTYRNEFARSQKILGAVPGDLNFQRSVDLITKDKAYFVEGQMVYQTGDNPNAMFPSLTYDDQTTGSSKYKPYEAKCGNFIHKNMHVGLDSHGSVQYMYFDVEDVTPTGLTPELVNGASAHKIIKMNTAELDRMVIDTKAGDEKGELWSPLARAVKEPTQTVAFLSSIEAQTGAYVHLAYSKATTNFSFFLNRGAKDGLDITHPMIEEVEGSYTAHRSMSDFTTTPSNLFSADAYRQGSPALMIEAYDSKAKYNNKADLILQPRGWRMHLQTADNNMNPLKVPAEYATVYAGQETYSTIEHEYDGLLPVCMTDKACLVDSINLNQVSAFCKAIKDYNFSFKIGDSGNGELVANYLHKVVTLVPTGYQLPVYAYYINLDHTGISTAPVLDYASNVIKVHPNTNDGNLEYEVIVLNRVLTDAELGEGGAYEGYTALNSGNGITGGLSIWTPTDDSSSHHISDCGDTPVDYGRLYYQASGEFKYMYEDIRNKYIVTVKHPLTEGIVQYLEQSIGAKFFKLLDGDSNNSINELYVPLVFSTQHMTLAQLLICAATPWIVRERTNSMKDVIYYEDNIHEYPFSKLISLKDSPFKNYVNFGYSGYDEPLQSKIMQPTNAISWTMPEFFWHVNDGTYDAIVCPWYFNEEEVASDDSSAMSFPSIRSGVRLGSLDSFYGMSEKDVRLSLDRMTKAFFSINSNKYAPSAAYKYGRTTDGQPVIQFDSPSDTYVTIGDILTCPRELGLCMDLPLGVLSPDPADKNDGKYPRKAFSASGIGTSYIIKCWVNPAADVSPRILSTKGVNINRASNYIQNWFAMYANEDANNTQLNGLVFGTNDEGNALFSPFIGLNNAALEATAPNVRSLQRSLWTRIQTLPFIISPFDAVGATNNLGFDIYDIAYVFGLAGFRASDYRESVYNREKEVVNQGFLFVSDPWVNESPIIKHGSSSTGIVNAKGFTVRKTN